MKTKFVAIISAAIAAVCTFLICLVALPGNINKDAAQVESSVSETVAEKESAKKSTDIKGSDKEVTQEDTSAENTESAAAEKDRPSSGSGSTGSGHSRPSGSKSSSGLKKSTSSDSISSSDESAKTGNRTSSDSESSSSKKSSRTKPSSGRSTSTGSKSSRTKKSTSNADSSSVQKSEDTGAAEDEQNADTGTDSATDQTQSASEDAEKSTRPAKPSKSSKAEAVVSGVSEVESGDKDQDKTPAISLSCSEAELEVGDTLVLTAETTEDTLVWSSEDPSVADAAQASDGSVFVTAYSPGTTVITAESSDGSVKASCSISVYETRAYAETDEDGLVTVNFSSDIMNEGEEYDLILCFDGNYTTTVTDSRTYTLSEEESALFLSSETVTVQVCTDSEEGDVILIKGLFAA